MKINLLREDQISEKVPHQKDEDMLRFGDNFSESGNDDFYFRQAEPNAEVEYKKPKKRRAWLYTILLLLIILVGAYIVNPQKTEAVFNKAGQNIKYAWNRAGDRVQTWWIDRGNSSEKNDFSAEYSQGLKKVDQAEKQVLKEEAPVEAVETIRVQEVKEIVEYKTLPSEAVYSAIRDEIALSRRNQEAVSLFWSKIPAGVFVTEMTMRDDMLNFKVKSLTLELIEQCLDEISAERFFRSRSGGNMIKEDAFYFSGMNINLPSPRKAERPDKLWDLEFKWLSGYFDIIQEATAVEYSVESLNSQKIGSNIIRHQVQVNVVGSRAAMVIFMKETGTIPASIIINEVTTQYIENTYKQNMKIQLTYYERD